jgi:hypothetical protein
LRATAAFWCGGSSQRTRRDLSQPRGAPGELNSRRLLATVERAYLEAAAIELRRAFADKVIVQRVTRDPRAAAARVVQPALFDRPDPVGALRDELTRV